MKKFKFIFTPIFFSVESNRNVSRTKAFPINWGLNRCSILAVLIFLFCASVSFGYANDLKNKGYSLIPAPQLTVLTENSILINENWGVSTAIKENNMALKRLRNGAMELHGVHFDGKGSGKIILVLVDFVIAKNLTPEQTEQAYRIEIDTDVVRIVSNGQAGLYYGVQSFLQLMRSNGRGALEVPQGTITDWPDLSLRLIHWDTKHHQDRMETLKRYLDWAAFFKVNAVAFEIEDKYEFPSHPVIGAPGAFTKKELQELTAYARERYIELIPLIQAPSHMTYVLKHEEFKHLRADNSNYHICMCDEDSYDLIFDLYQDMIDATPGVEHFFVSTDEVYYAGICEKCKDEYNEVNRSQTWVDFVNRVHDWMAERDRKVIAWVEFPLLPEHIEQLPFGLIDGIMSAKRSREWIDNQNSAGIEQLAYSSIQGAEFLFPNYFPTLFKNKLIDGSLSDTSKRVPEALDKGANLIGTFAAAWDDSGLHNETFWLGWATVSQYGWTANQPSIEQSTSDFMDVFYGSKSPEMAEVYKSLEEGAQFYQTLWEKTEKPTTERQGRYGSSHGKGIGGDFSDLILKTPVLPTVNDLQIESIFRSTYSEKIKKASEISKSNDRLIEMLLYSLSRVNRNRYNLEVLLSIAYLERYTINMVLNFAQIEDQLLLAAKTIKPQTAISHMINADKLVGKILEEEKRMWEGLTLTWDKSRFEKGRSVNGRDFVHIFDDVKDHFADRRIGLEYMLAPFERMEIGKWRSNLNLLVKDYAKANKVDIKGFAIERLED